MFGPAPLPRSFEASLRDRESERLHVRLSAVRDLGRHAASDRSGQALAALRETLASDASAEVRGAAALSLADADARTASGALVQAMGDSSVHVRQMALLALGEVGDADNVDLLSAVQGALDDAAPALRFQALIACHNLNASCVESALFTATGDADAEVRHVAFRLLEERAGDADGLARPSEAVKEAARAGLADGILSVRLAAAILLARSGDHAGDSVIAAALAERGGIEPDDEQAAIVLSGELSIEGARPGLERRAFGFLVGRDRFRYEARIALAKLGDVRARNRISRELTAWSRDTRTLAVVAAGRAELVEARHMIEAMRGDPGRAEPEAVEEALVLLSRPGS